MPMPLIEPENLEQWLNIDASDPYGMAVETGQTAAAVSLAETIVGCYLERARSEHTEVTADSKLGT